MCKQMIWVFLASLSLTGCWVDNDPLPYQSQNGNPGPAEPEWDKPNKYQDRDHDGGRGGRGASM